MSKGKRYSEQELEYIKIHSQDMTIGEIATALGRNYWSVQRVMQNRQGVELSDTQKRQIELMRKEGLNINQIAKKVGVSYYVIYGYLNKRVNLKQNHRFTADEDFKIRQMYGKYRVRYIATVLGLTEEQVFNRAKRLGIQKKGSTEWRK